MNGKAGVAVGDIGAGPIELLPKGVQSHKTPLEGRQLRVQNRQVKYNKLPLLLILFHEVDKDLFIIIINDFG